MNAAEMPGCFDREMHKVTPEEMAWLLLHDAFGSDVVMCNFEYPESWWELEDPKIADVLAMPGWSEAVMKEPCQIGWRTISDENGERLAPVLVFRNDVKNTACLFFGMSQDNWLNRVVWIDGGQVNRPAVIVDAIVQVLMRRDKWRPSELKALGLQWDNGSVFGGREPLDEKPAPPPGPEKLRELLGDQFFEEMPDHVREVVLNMPEKDRMEFIRERRRALAVVRLLVDRAGPAGLRIHEIEAALSMTPTEVMGVVHGLMHTSSGLDVRCVPGRGPREDRLWLWGPLHQMSVVVVG